MNTVQASSAASEAIRGLIGSFNGLAVSTAPTAALLATFSVEDLGGGLISRTFDEFPAMRAFFEAGVRKASIAGRLATEDPAMREMNRLSRRFSDLVADVATGVRTPIAVRELL